MRTLFLYMVREPWETLFSYATEESMNEENEAREKNSTPSLKRPLWRKVTVEDLTITKEDGE